MNTSRFLPKQLCFSKPKKQYFINRIYHSASIRFQPNEANIIIVGAGLAGLTAAKHLRKHNFTNIKILEASNRYGGRIKTKKFGNISVELGSKRISIMRNAISFLDEILHIDSLKRLEIEPVFVKSDGQMIPADLNENITKSFKYILNDFGNNNFNAIDKKIKNGKEYFETETEKKSKILFGHDSQIASSAYQALISDLQSFFGCDMSYVHIENLKNMLNIYTNSSLLGQNMIDTLLPLIHDLHDIIYYNKPVTKINFYAGEIYCVDGTKYIADHIICTLPLGHLKAYQSYLFEPELPEMKSKSIYELGIGTPESIYIKYDENLDNWFPAKRSYYPLWNSDESSDSRGLYKNITAIHRMPESENILQVNCCKGYECNANEDIILRGVRKFLKRFTNKKLNATEILKSNWASDPKFLGGIPYLTDANSKRYVDALTAPIYWRMSENYDKPVLMFAGDATELNGFGTLEGAAKSGLREGKRVIDYHLKKYYNI